MNVRSSVATNLAVIVVSFNDPTILRQCLEALSAQIDQSKPDSLTLLATRSSTASATSTAAKLPTRQNDNAAQSIDVIVVRCGTYDNLGRMDNDIAHLRVQFPWYTWLDAPVKTTVPKMRKLGLQASKAEIVALIEDDCLVQPNWCTNIIEAHKHADGAVGGSVEPSAFKTGLDWAVFFCDYARYMSPFEGTVHALPGNNLSYKREVLSELDNEQRLDNGLYEVFVNSELQRKGKTLHADNSVSVKNINSWRIDHATVVPFHHGRGFAAMRFSAAQVQQRLLYAAVALILPGLQTLRISQQVLSRKRYTGELLLALPTVILYWSCWSIGEFMGYLLGPGSSLEKWQ